MILAYEPVWAIGTGETASIEHINEIHRSVKSELSKLSLDIPILYGGSVNPTNSKEILSQELVDGVLIGGASTKHEDLHKIIKRSFLCYLKYDSWRCSIGYLHAVLFTFVKI